VSGLVAYYEALGYPTSRRHIGAEHPALEAQRVALPAALACIAGRQGVLAVRRARGRLAGRR